MSKTLKYILIGFGVLVFVWLGIPFLKGFSGTVNPKKAIELAQQQSAENIYKPEGYVLSAKNMEIKDENDNPFYVTTIKNGDKIINIMSMKLTGQTCKGKIRTLGNKEVCYFDKGSFQAEPTKRTATWNKLNTSFQIDIYDPSLSEIEIGKIISSI